ncbi:MAG: HEAT repeat domain-containing protein [Ignavibacteriota bacterium]|nr:HEAT repeat domain-containing protein [Ignavibacterium album]MCZ2269894.1 HEAT repeat domain-containing protein [Ignavibacteriales bacterium]QKJ98304.1 MAG: HEAT repeat domain-containing protein [Ignavibacteriota bacterium]HOJ08222.1 HEAT repeat domain-containing protein [Ignavibacteriaceae bacterium]
MLTSKYLKSLSAILLLLIVFAGSISAQVDDQANKVISKKTIESLIQGLEIDNDGLQSSCAYWLGEYKITEAVVPLQKLLSQDESEAVRISAALALFKLGTPIAIHSLKGAIRFDESERVRRFSSIFYSAYLDQLKENENQIEEKGWLARKN